LYLTAFSTSYLLQSVSVGWLIGCQKYVTALMLWREVTFFLSLTTMQSEIQKFASVHQPQETYWM
jgi:predicted phage-related endonuclease